MTSAAKISVVSAQELSNDHLEQRVGWSLLQNLHVVYRCRVSLIRELEIFPRSRMICLVASEMVCSFLPTSKAMNVRHRGSQKFKERTW